MFIYGIPKQDKEFVPQCMVVRFFKLFPFKTFLYFSLTYLTGAGELKAWASSLIIAAIRFHDARTILFSSPILSFQTIMDLIGCLHMTPNSSSIDELPIRP